MKKIKEESALSQILKGVCLGVIFNFIAVIVFSFIIEITGITDNVIKPVNQFIKIISVFISCYFTLEGNKGYLKGLTVGLFVFLITNVIFWLISGGVFFSLSFIIDVIFCSLIGLISGIISVNIKKG